jgi:ComF family protein
MDVKTWWHGLRHLLLPGCCWGCNGLLEPQRDAFCANCELRVTHDPHPTCPRCSKTVGPFSASDDGCMNCRHESFAFEKSIRLGPYADLLRDLILRCKQPDGDGLAGAMGSLFAQARIEKLRALQADVVTAVPLHWWRQLRRGFNQSSVLADAIARSLKVRYESRWLVRVRATERQATLAHSERRGNVSGAFRARPRPEWKGRSVLLVDDVMTTGSTAHFAAMALREAGAGRIVIAVLGHG